MLRIPLLLLLLLSLRAGSLACAFVFVGDTRPTVAHLSSAGASRILRQRSRPLFYSSDDKDSNDEEEIKFITTTAEQEPTTQTKKKPGHWDSLHPRIKERLVQAGQQRAVANKQRREPAADRKRRQYAFVREQQRAKKRAARVPRPLPLYGDSDGGSDRMPLSALLPGMQCQGVVISLTPFGAYVDVGSEVDGLLHVSQMASDGTFVTHPRQVVAPGDSITVTVRSRDPVAKKLHLTRLPAEVVEEQLARERRQNRRRNESDHSDTDNDTDDDDDDDDRIPLTDLQPDDELWGELKRVTDFGAYVEVGAEVDGFLHFMDHPVFDYGMTSHNLMRPGDRVRVWVSDVDLERRRVKLTAVRPDRLPGPRRELDY